MSTLTHSQLQATAAKAVPLNLYIGTMVLTAALSFAASPPSLTDWDSWEYAGDSINLQPSGLCLGRWWFNFFMHVSYRAGEMTGLPMTEKFVPMRVAVGLMSAAGVALLMHWSFLLTGRKLAAGLAGIMAVISQPFIAYSWVVMTEGPTLMFLILSFVLWEKARSKGRPISAVFSGLAFGVVVSMREPALLLAAWPIVSCIAQKHERQWRMLLLCIAGAIISLGLAVAMTSLWRGQWPWQFLPEYQKYMALERATFGLSAWKNLALLGGHLYLCSPIAILGLGGFLLMLPLLPRKVNRQTESVAGILPASAEAVSAAVFRQFSSLGLAALPYAIMTWYNPDLIFNYRLALPLAWMLIPIAAWLGAQVFDGILAQKSPAHFAPHSRFGQVRSSFVNWCNWSLLCLAVAAIIGWAVMSSVIAFGLFWNYADFQARLYERVKLLPQGIALVAGGAEPMAYYLSQANGQDAMTIIRPGFESDPIALAEKIRSEIRSGKRVFINSAGTSWVRPGEVNIEWEAVKEVMAKFRIADGPKPFVEVLDDSLDQTVSPG